MNNYTKFIVRTTFVYLGFYSLIAIAIYWTKSAAPLWALLLTPTSSYHDDGEKEEDSIKKDNSLGEIKITPYTSFKIKK